jgi:predicted site-specific integrase-resolvase
VEKLLTDQQLSDESGLKTRTIKTLRLEGKIPSVMLGAKTIRYRLSSVEAALTKLERKAVSTAKKAAL